MGEGPGGYGGMINNATISNAPTTFRPNATKSATSTKKAAWASRSLWPSAAEMSPPTADRSSGRHNREVTANATKLTAATPYKSLAVRARA